jgi:hypothetical protein
MKSSFTHHVVLGISIIILSGCASDRALVATKTNIGFDIDTKPPTAEITIARRELAIQPTFPNVDQSTGGETSLPILASFNLQGAFFAPRIIGHFAGGDAAVHLAQDDDEIVDSSLCLNSEPEDTRGGLLKIWHTLTLTDYETYKKTPRYFYFATDTMFGLKAAWSGTTGPYPDSFKLGYNRKEFASPPIFINQGCKSDAQKWSVHLPSFYASIDNASALSTITGSSVNNVQFFATGKAATAFAKRKSVRQIAFANMAPDAAENEAKELNQDLIEDIEKIFNSSDTSKQKNILNKAIDLGLIAKETTAKEFQNKLKIHAKGINYSVSTKLNQLRAFAIDQ